MTNFELSVETNKNEKNKNENKNEKYGHHLPGQQFI